VLPAVSVALPHQIRTTSGVQGCSIRAKSLRVKARAHEVFLRRGLDPAAIAHRLRLGQPYLMSIPRRRTLKRLRGSGGEGWPRKPMKKSRRAGRPLLRG